MLCECGPVAKVQSPWNVAKPLDRVHPAEADSHRDRDGSRRDSELDAECPKTSTGQRAAFVQLVGSYRDVSHLISVESAR